MAEGEPPHVNLRKAYRKIKSAQRNLFYAGECDPLIEELIVVKEKVIKEYERRGGVWEVNTDKERS